MNTQGSFAPGPSRRRSEDSRRGSSAAVDLGRKHKPDYWLVALCVLLLAIGMMVVYAISPALAASSGSSSSHFVIKQLIATALSLVAFGITSQLPLGTWRRLYKPLLAAAGGATLLALAIPVNPAYPAHRWVRLGGSFSFQSVELLKFAILIALAGYLAQHARDASFWVDKQVLKPLLIAFVVIALVVAAPDKVHGQSDLGSMAVITAMVAVICFVAGLPIRQLMRYGAVLAIGAVLIILPVAYRVDRLTNFLHPDCKGSGYQECQALIAVGSGGMIGLGLGKSVQANGYLPEAANDSIFAIYAEIFGFLGSAVLLGIFIALFGRLKGIAERAPDDFSRYLTTGVLVWLSTQTIINIGAMIGLLPLKGITLPFISYGGTSVVFVAAAVGLVFQVSKYTSYVAPLNDERGRDDNSRDRRRVRGAYHPNPGSST